MSKKAACLSLLLLPFISYAHVKWFVDFDIHERPASFSAVITPNWLVFFVLSIIAVFCFQIIDRKLMNANFTYTLRDKFKTAAHYVFPIFRLMISIYFISICFYGDFVFAPDLEITNPIIFWSQLVIGLLIIPHKTSPLAAALILLLYAYCLVQFGLLHMFDYLVISGVAMYILLSYFEHHTQGKRAQTLHHTKLLLLYGTLTFSLCWGAMEKFFYAGRFITVLDEHPAILMGFPMDIYINIAGFVEFTLAFLLVTGFFFSRLVAVALLSIFILGVYEFGLLDFIGHLLIMFAFIVVLIKGSSRYSDIFLMSNKSLLHQSTIMVGLYILTLSLFMAMYFGLGMLSMFRASS